MRSIGLSGFAGSGKTTAARYIEERYGFRRKHIAEPLRAMLAPLYAAAGVPTRLVGAYLEGNLKEMVVPGLGRTSRELQVSLGTEWGRKLVDQDLWAKLWTRNNNPGDRVMNDSVRFPNEEALIKGMGGITILIRRPGCHPAAFRWGYLGELVYNTFGVMWGVHDSERTDRLTPTYVIDNHGTVEDLHRAIDRVLVDAGALPVGDRGPSSAQAHP